MQGTERLSACVEALRLAPSASDQLVQQTRLFQELLALQARWPQPNKPSNNLNANGPVTTLFAQLLQALVVYSGGYGGGHAGGGSTSTGMSLPLLSTTVPTSESVQHLLTELLTRAYDFAAAPMIHELMHGKYTALYVRATLLQVVSRLRITDMQQFVGDAVAVAARHLRAADFYLKQCLLEAVARILQRGGARLASFHGEALKMALKLVVDKTPEVRLAAAAVLHAVATTTTAAVGQSAAASGTTGSSAALNGGAGSGMGNGAGATDGASGGVGNGAGTSAHGNTGAGAGGSAGVGAASSMATGSSSGAGASGSSGVGGVTLESIMQAAGKGLDDVAPEVRRAFAATVGVVLAKFASSSPSDLRGSLHGAPPSFLPPVDDPSDGIAISTDGDNSLAASSSSVVSSDSNTNPNSNSNGNGNGSGSGSGSASGSGNGPGLGNGNGSVTPSRARRGFKLNLPGMSLTRRKATTAEFAGLASVILYLKDLVTTKYLAASTNPQHHHGGILASYAVALTSMFTHLPVDTITDYELGEVVDALLAVLDHTLTLADLTRARNAVGYVLRFGLLVVLSERQQESLLRVYLQRIATVAEDEEGNHHKALALLVEMAHLLPSLGEASVVHAREATQVLHALLTHEKQSVRFQAGVVMASLLTALPYMLKSGLLQCVTSLRETTSLLLRDRASREHAGQALEEAAAAAAAGEYDQEYDQDSTAQHTQSKTHLYAIQGYSTAIAHVVRALGVPSDASSLPVSSPTASPPLRSALCHNLLTSLLHLATRLIESQFIEACADSIWLTCTRAGWTLVGSLVTIQDDVWTPTTRRTLMDLWLRASVLQTREASLELLRMEAAVIALHSFLMHGVGGYGGESGNEDESRSDQSVYQLTAHVLHTFLTVATGQLSKPQKRRGQHARHRLLGWILKCFTALPPVFSDSYVLLLDVATEYTTAQALTSLRHAANVPPTATTYLCNALSGEDDALEMASLPRLVAGDDPSVLYTRDLNHILALLQRDNTLTDTEVEVQYLDTFWGLVCDHHSWNDVYERRLCSSFTYTRLADASVFLFGRMFHFLPDELQLRCLQHLAGVLADTRIECEVNVCALLFAVTKQAKMGVTAVPSSSSTSTTLPPNCSWAPQVQAMLSEMLSSVNSTVRRGAAEALALLAAVLPEPQARALVRDLEQRLAPTTKLSLSSSSPASSTSPSAVSSASNATATPSISAATATSTAVSSSSSTDVCVMQAGVVFALACIKRVCGSGIIVDSSLLFRFAGEVTQPLRSWMLHSWSIIVESVSASGGDDEHYIASSVALMDAQLVAGFLYNSRVNKRNLRWHSSARVSMARIINAVTATLGPELAIAFELSEPIALTPDTIDAAEGPDNPLPANATQEQPWHRHRLTDFYTIWGMLRQDGDPRVELEFLKFVEQVVVFAPAQFRRHDLLYILNLLSDGFVDPALDSEEMGLLLAPSRMTDSFSASAPGPPTLPTETPSSSSFPISSRDSFSSLGWQHARNALVCVHGQSRHMLQQVGMSCLRTLTERDPGVIRRHNLPCVLFHALHVEQNAQLWGYQPALHGMWDLLAFTVYIPCKSRNAVGEICHTIFALIDIDGGDWRGCEPCTWALLCRGIAVGESGQTSAAFDAEQELASPRDGSFIGDDNDPTVNNSTMAPSDKWNLVGETGPHVITAAVAAQVATWRRTKRHVSDLLAMLPLLSRPVRQFAVQCVVRVFELVKRGSFDASTGAGSHRSSIGGGGGGISSGFVVHDSEVQPHFDAIQARQRFIERLTAVSAAPDVPVDQSAISRSATGNDGALNFLSMYLDEFVTLACHVTMSSADGKHELPAFQCMGLRFLKVVVACFAHAKDPEVQAGEGDAYVLDPYQAQISSAVRHAIRQVQTTAIDQVLLASSPAGGGGDHLGGVMAAGGNEDVGGFYAPLAVEAFALCGDVIRCRLVQDKVALGRLLRMTLTEDYGHTHFIGDEVTRTSLVLANLSCVARLVSSSVDASASGSASSAVTSLARSVTSNLAPSMAYLLRCWMDATLSYGLLMQGQGPWPQLIVTRERRAVQSSVLKLVLPVVKPTTTPPSSSSRLRCQSGSGLLTSGATNTRATVDVLRSLFKQAWPTIPLAMACWQEHAGSVATQEMSAHCALVLSYSVFHVATCVRDREHRVEDQLVPVLRAIPQLLRVALQAANASAGASAGSGDDEGNSAIVQTLNALAFVSEHSSGLIRDAALDALFACLGNAQVAQGLSESDQACRLAVQSALCPLQLLAQYCSRQVPSSSRPGPTHTTAVAHSNEERSLVAMLRIAASGIVFLHTNPVVRPHIVDALPLVTRCCRRFVELGSPSLTASFTTLHRAVLESSVAWLKEATSTDTRAVEGDTTTSQCQAGIEQVGNALATVAQLMTGLTPMAEAMTLTTRFEGDDDANENQEEVASLVSTTLTLVANCALLVPSCLTKEAHAFHDGILAVSCRVLSGTVPSLASMPLPTSCVSLASALLTGLRAVVQKMVDSHNTGMAHRYLAVLAPLLLEILNAQRDDHRETNEAAVLREVELFLRVVSAQLSDAHGDAFVQLLLPKLATLLLHHESSSSEVVTSIVARLLLFLAQTRSAAFKSAVVDMAPKARDLLQLTLRSALAGTASAAPAPPSSSTFAAYTNGGTSTSNKSSSHPRGGLDLSRYG